MCTGARTPQNKGSSVILRFSKKPFFPIQNHFFLFRDLEIILLVSFFRFFSLLVSDLLKTPAGNTLYVFSKELENKNIFVKLKTQMPFKGCTLTQFQTRADVTNTFCCTIERHLYR